MAPKQPSVLSLSSLIVGPSELARASRQLESLDEALHQEKLRQNSTAKTVVPAAGQTLEDLFKHNNLDINLAADRQTLLTFLAEARKASPVITISFAVEPSSDFIGKIIDWLRQNIHPQILLRTGLQPNLVAGCSVRTASHYYDCSLRNRFEAQRPLLLERLRAERLASE